MAVTSRHNKYTSIPDWFSGQSTETATTSPTTSQIVYVGSSSSSTTGNSTVDFKDIPIDNLTIVWLNEQLTVPIDNDKLIIVDGKVTTSANASGVWELRLLADGTNYIYTTYPVVTQLGITMYSGTEGLDIGGIYDGLPIDNTTIYWDIDSNGNKVLKAIGSSSGGGVADSVAWANVVGKPIWLLDDKISYSEIEGTPDLSNYVVKSYVDDKFVTFTLHEVITGIKSFTNGLKIGESLIKQLQKDVVYIDANLVVRGGITMYGNDSEFVPSTIMDAILYDDTTLGINANGQLYVKGGTGGGTVSGDYLPLIGGTISGTSTYPLVVNTTDVQSGIQFLSNNDLLGVIINGGDYGTALINFKGKYRALGIDNDGNAYTTIDNSNTKANLLHTYNYSSYALPLSGGTLSSTTTGAVLQINTANAVEVGARFLVGMQNKGWIGYHPNLGTNIYNYASKYALGVKDDGGLFYDGGTIWHSGNDGSGSGLDADLLDGYDSSLVFINRNIALNANNINTTLTPGCYHTSNYSPISGVYKYGTILNFRGGARQTQFYIPDGAQQYSNGGRLFFRDSWNANDSITTAWHEIITSASVGSFNAGSATRIQAYTHNNGEKVIISSSRSDNTFPRKIYDNGIGLVISQTESSGTVHNGYIASVNSNVASATKLQTARTIWGQSFDGTGNVTNDLYLPNHKFIWGTKTDGTTKLGLMSLNSSNLLVIGTDTAVNGIDTYISGNNINFRYSTSTVVGMKLTSTGNVGIGTTSPSFKLHVAGGVLADAFYAMGGIYGWNADTSTTFNNRWGMYQWGHLLQITQRDVHNNFITTPISIDLANGRVAILKQQPTCALDVSGDILASGGITMYSARKLKTIQDERGLSLEELSVIKPTRFTWKDGRDNKVHIGGIADDVMKVLPEVIYKTGEDDTLTMDYGNAAFAISASLIKPVVNHEERIRLLEEENKRLKEEVEQLK